MTAYLPVVVTGVGRVSEVLGPLHNVLQQTVHLQMSFRMESSLSIIENLVTVAWAHRGHPHHVHAVLKVPQGPDDAGLRVQTGVLLVADARHGVLVGDPGEIHQVHVLHVLVGRDALPYHKVYQVDGPPHLAEHGVPVLPRRHRVRVAEDALGAGHQQDGRPGNV